MPDTCETAPEGLSLPWSESKPDQIELVQPLQNLRTGDDHAIFQRSGLVPMSISTVEGIPFEDVHHVALDGVD